MIRLGLLVASVFLAIAAGFSLARAAANQEPPYRCTTDPQWGFNRAHYGLWNFCAIDGYGPPEYMYWNYLPGTTGYNNPSVGPYYSYVAQAVYDCCRPTELGHYVQVGGLEFGD